MEAPHSASREHVQGAWPRYDAAVLGFRNYWYPVLLSRQVLRQPRPVTLCGEKIVLVRERGVVYGLRDRCPHCGSPLSAGRRGPSGGLTCARDGRTFDPRSGRPWGVHAQNGSESTSGEGPKVQTYPVAERAGVVWVYVGELDPPPVEADIPAELLRPDAVVEGLVEIRKGNWRYACENSVDEGHAKYLHRTTPWTFFSEFPAWTRGVNMVPSEDGQWLMRIREQSIFEDDYPRIGRWPPKYPWQSRMRGPSQSLGIRLPCMLRVVLQDWTDYEIFVPVDENHHRAVFLAVKFATGTAASLFRLRFYSYIRPLYYGLLNRGQDQWMIELMQTPPERLYRPDVSITAWRKWCEEQARAGSN